MATDYGRDLSCITDLSPTMDEVTGRTVVLEAALRRISTRRGMVIDCANDGTDVGDLLSQDVGPGQLARIRAVIEGELVKDDRIFAASIIRNSFVPATGVLTLSIRLQDADGPFTLTVAVSALTVQLLEVS